jgi:predicted nucleic acid-binding protein
VIRLVLDTSAYSHFKRNDEAAVSIIASAEWIGIPAIVLGELRAGFRRGARAEANERELSTFLAHRIVHVLDVDDDAATVYADCVAALLTAGTPLPTNDIWIAAVAAREGATVVTYDAHFRAITRVASRILTR